MGYLHYSEAVKQRAVQMYKDGHTQVEIADSLDCHQTTVSQWLEERGVETRDPQPDNALDRFCQYIDKDNDGCWQWCGHKARGYGRFWTGRRVMGAHRFAWEFYNKKPIPGDQLVCHHCDNPSCVNPEHLWTGTQSDNIQDAIDKGRFTQIQHLKPFQEEDIRD